MKAIQLFTEQKRSIKSIIRELGYPSRSMFYYWYKEYKKNGELRTDKKRGHSKYTDEQRKQAIEYYLEHGKNITHTINVLGFPKRTALRDWIIEDIPDNEKGCLTGRTLIKYSQEEKEQAVKRFCIGDSTAKEIATEMGVTESAFYSWKRRLLSERCEVTLLKKNTSNVNKDTKKHIKNQDELISEKESLLKQVAELQREIHRLQLEKDILEKAGEIIKKDQGINLAKLTNREKAVLIDALRNKYRLTELLRAMKMVKSSYCYQMQALYRSDKYKELRKWVKDIFEEAHSCYGYRRVHAFMQREGATVSEKVIRKIMKDENLTVSKVKKRKYNSYAGEISPGVENIINRDFNADTPNTKWLTDITEFSISAGKVYLSPIIDCFDGMAVAWTIGTSPDADLVNTMLDTAVSLLDEDEHPIIHSDRGGHYRWPGWIERAENAKLTRSMSKKACSPDNAACEGFFGRIKNEMFYGRSWLGTTLDEFMTLLDSYIKWYNETRIKMSLGAMSPVEYRKNLGLYTNIVMEV
jgi:transposase InsO family protein/transposase-like protein